MDFEQKQIAAMEAADDAEKQKSVLRQLEHELERDTTSLSCSDYMTLQARCSQQRERVRIATEKAQRFQREADDLRDRETARMQHDQAQRAYDGKLAELNTTRAEIAAKQQAIRDLQNQIQAHASRQTVLLYELDQARTALARLQQPMEVTQ